MNQPQVLVLGIGNLLWADEGFGVRAVEALNQAYQFPDHVHLMDGGTQGLYLVPYVQQADVLIVFDAIDYGLTPGTMKIIRDAEVPKFMGAKKMSLHQTGFQEVLATAELLGQAPEKLLLIGVQPQQLEDYGGSLRPEVRAQIEPAIEVALDYLAALGIEARERTDENNPLADTSLALDAYEAYRPSDHEACRTGDARVLQSSAFRFDPKASDTNLSVDLDQRRQD